jgi:enamine deaminase RidA (YjgF/YER057c/UK114 family)
MASRIRPVTPAGFGPPLGMYSHGVVAPGGELVVIAGQVGIGAGGAVAVDDVVGQTKQALDNVRQVLEAAGCTVRDVVRLQTFLTRADDIAGFMKARSEVFPGWFPDGVYPPNTLLVVSRLVRPELLVEVEAMAVRPARKRTRPSALKSTPAPRRRRRR